MQKNQNVFLFYVRVLLYCLVALLIRAAALAPLAALFVFPADSLWRWLWVVSPLMVVFLVLPLRFSFADALVQRPRTRDFSIDRALSLRQYGEKLAESLRHALSVLKWAIPLAGLGAWGYYLKEQYTVKGLLDGLRELGKNVSGTWYAVVNFFRGLFGHLPLETVEGSYMQGVYTVLALVGLGLLILLYGAVRNSATRYIWAVANHEDRPVRREIRRRLRGRRMAQLGTALCNLLLCVPFLWLYADHQPDMVEILRQIRVVIRAAGLVFALHPTQVGAAFENRHARFQPGGGGHTLHLPAVDAGDPVGAVVDTLPKLAVGVHKRPGAVDPLGVAGAGGDIGPAQHGVKNLNQFSDGNHGASHPA